MTTTDRINAACDNFAAVLDAYIGAGCALGAPEVARATRVSDDTVRSYRDGRTVPDLLWLLRFSNAYRDGFPEMVAKVWRAFENVVGGRFELDAPAVHPDVSPMHITFGIDERLTTVQRALADVTCPKSPGGAGITAAERERLDPSLAAIIVQAEGLKLAIEARTLRSQAG